MDAYELEQQQDESLARQAMAKRRAGQTVTKAEIAALARFENLATLRRLQKVTPKFFREITGMQTKQLHDWEDRYNIPCGRGRETINVLDVFAGIRNLISDFAKGKRTGGGSEATDQTEGELKIEKAQKQIAKLEEQVRKLRMENQASAHESIPRQQLVQLHTMLQADLRTLGEEYARMGQLDGPTAQRKLNATITSCKRRLKPLMANELATEEGDA